MEELRNMDHTPVKIIAFLDEGLYVAHCVDHNIAACAEKLDVAIARLRLTVEAEKQYAEHHGLEPFAGIGPAPAYIKDMYAKASMNVRTDNEDAEFKLAA